MEFIIDDEINTNHNHIDNGTTNKNNSDLTIKKRNKVNPNVDNYNNAFIPVFYSKEQREKMMREELKKKEEEEKKKQNEKKQHLNEYLNSKYQDNSRKDRHRERSRDRSRSNSRDRSRRKRERDDREKDYDGSIIADKMIPLQEKEKEEIKVKFNTLMINVL